MKTGEAKHLVPLCWLVLACSDSPQRLDHEGDPCRSLASFCADEDSEMRCVDGRWALRPCGQVCGEQAGGLEPLGCESTSAGDGACACEPPAGGCVPGEAECADEQNLSTCGGDWQWSTISCQLLCADQPTHTISLGCAPNEDTDSAACMCTAVGAACSDEGAVCLDDLTLVGCSGGVWTQTNCVDACGGAAHCEPGIGVDASCVCA